MIDFSLPCETDETPPRPVRVLFDDAGKAEAAILGGHIYRVDSDGWVTSGKSLRHVRLRNVAPPKPAPVLREAWVNLGPTGLQSSTSESRHEADRIAHETRVGCRRIAWMSDGSQVPGEECPDGYISRKVAERLELGALKERDRWKAEAERQTRHAQTISEAAAAVEKKIARMKPVVEMAEWAWAWKSAHPTANEAYLLLQIFDAVHNFQSKSEPVKSCDTCAEQAGGCSHYEQKECEEPTYKHWRAKQ